MGKEVTHNNPGTIIPYWQIGSFPTMMTYCNLIHTTHEQQRAGRDLSSPGGYYSTEVVLVHRKWNDKEKTINDDFAF